MEYGEALRGGSREALVDGTGSLSGAEEPNLEGALVQLIEVTKLAEAEAVDLFAFEQDTIFFGDIVEHDLQRGVRVGLTGLDGAQSCAFIGIGEGDLLIGKF